MNMVKMLRFLKSVEGNEYKPYVPASSTGKVLGQSGVTLGIGVDIGNMNPIFLDIPDELKDKLRPYYRMRGDNARYVLLHKPLKLEKAEIDLISMAAIELHLDELRKQFNAESKIPFDSLSDNQQTVLLSVKYQYGSLKSRTPKFWGFATDNNWNAVYHELMNFGDKYPSRRRREASLIARDFRPENQDAEDFSSAFT
jgi:hypothetical protein